MSTYIVLVSLTDQGIRSVKESAQRLDSAKELAGGMGIEFRDFYLTMGGYDMVCVVEGPDDHAAARFALSLGSKGNVRTTTLRAFPEVEYRDIVGSLV
ncbi:MAG: GYD domain-containing protein [Ectothiorhodospiraceae bacterium]|jgi:uncharacterized protein with GYD domain